MEPPLAHGAHTDAAHPQSIPLGSSCPPLFCTRSRIWKMNIGTGTIKSCFIPYHYLFLGLGWHCCEGTSMYVTLQLWSTRVLHLLTISTVYLVMLMGSHLISLTSSHSSLVLTSYPVVVQVPSTSSKSCRANWLLNRLRSSSSDKSNRSKSSELCCLPSLLTSSDSRIASASIMSSSDKSLALDDL